MTIDDLIQKYENKYDEQLQDYNNQELDSILMQDMAIISVNKNFIADLKELKKSQRE